MLEVQVHRPRVTGRVVAVSASPTHSFSKAPRTRITLLPGLGVEGDAHCGVTVKHRSRVEHDPTQPNLRQVHLVHAELFDELGAKGFSVGPSTVVKLTGLRNPCTQLDQLRAGLMSALLDRTPEGAIVRKAGVMGVVIAGGPVCAGDAVIVFRPAEPYRPLERV